MSFLSCTLLLGLTLHCLCFPEALYQYYRRAQTGLVLTLFSGTNIALSLFSRSSVSVLQTSPGKACFDPVDWDKHRTVFVFQKHSKYSISDRPRWGLLLPVLLLNCLVCVLEVFWEQAFQTGQDKDSVSLFHRNTCVCVPEAFRAPVFQTGPDKDGFSLGRAANCREVFGEDPKRWFLPLSTRFVHNDLTHHTTSFLSCTQWPNASRTLPQLHTAT